MRIPVTAVDKRLPQVGNEMRINLYRQDGQNPKRNFLAWQTTGVWNPHKPKKFGQLKLVSSQVHLARLGAGNMIVELDKRSGSIFSIMEKDGKFKTNFMGNTENSPNDDPYSPHWTGNIVSTT